MLTCLIIKTGLNLPHATYSIHQRHRYFVTSRIRQAWSIYEFISIAKNVFQRIRDPRPLTDHMVCGGARAFFGGGFSSARRIARPFAEDHLFTQLLHLTTFGKCHIFVSDRSRRCPSHRHTRFIIFRRNLLY